MPVKSLHFGLLVLSWGCAAAYAQSEATFRLVNIDIRAAARAVQDFTKQTVVLDPSVMGKVSLVSSRPVNAQEAIKLLATISRAHGWLVEIDEGQGLTLRQPTLLVARFGAEEKLQTRIYPLLRVAAAEISAYLRPLLSPRGRLIAGDDSALWVVDEPYVQVQIERAIARLDTARADADPHYKQRLPISIAASEPTVATAIVGLPLDLTSVLAPAPAPAPAPVRLLPPPQPKIEAEAVANPALALSFRASLPDVTPAADPALVLDRRVSSVSLSRSVAAVDDERERQARVQLSAQNAPAQPLVVNEQDRGTLIAAPVIPPLHVQQSVSTPSNMLQSMQPRVLHIEAWMGSAGKSNKHQPTQRSVVAPQTQKQLDLTEGENATVSWSSSNGKELLRVDLHSIAAGTDTLQFRWQHQWVGRAGKRQRSRGTSSEGELITLIPGQDMALNQIRWHSAHFAQPLVLYLRASLLPVVQAPAVDIATQETTNPAPTALTPGFSIKGDPPVSNHSRRTKKSRRK